MTQQTKAFIRAMMREHRNKLTATQIDQSARAICRHLLATPMFQASEKIACYISFMNEVPTAALIQAIWTAGKRCYLPVLNPNMQDELTFIHYEAHDDLTCNRYGIAEPAYAEAKQIPVSDLDLVLVPLVAFDSAGNRLGMGAGYYDRRFAFLNQQATRTQPKLVGLAYDFQRVSHLEKAPWDVALDAVVTEQGTEQFVQV